MDNLSLQILLVEDNLTDVLLLRDALDQVPTVTFVLTHVERLDAGLERLQAQRFDAVLLDLGLPDSQGLATLNKMQSLHPDVPIMVLSGLDDENLAVSAVQSGAQDYMVKGKINGTMVALTIRYAIERKRTEQRLMAAEAGYRRLFETAQDGIFLLDADTGQITDANSSLETLLGYTLAEFVGKRLWEIAPFRDKAANLAAFRTLQEKGFIRYEDLPLAAKDGRFIPVEFVSNVYAVGDKRVIQCNIRDITERKRVEARLRASEASLAKSQEMARLGSWELDLSNLDDINANPLHWSDEIFRILGFAPGEFEPTNAAFLSAVHPDDRKNLSRAMAEAVGGGRPYSVDHRIILPNGQERIVHAEAEMIYDESGRPLKIVGLGQDITERKLAETALYEREEFQRTLLENFPNGSVNVFDRDLRYVLAAGHGLERVGIAVSQLVGKSLYDLFSPEQVAVVKPYYEEAFGGKTVEFVLPLHERFYNICAAPLRDRDGKIFNIIAVAQDITERKQAEEALARNEREQRELARQLEKEKVRLVEAQTVAKVGSWDLDLSANILNWSDENYRIFGIDRTKFEATYEAFLERIHPDDRAMVDKAYTDSVANRTPYAIDHRLQMADGSIKFVHERCNTFYDDLGRPVRSVGTTQDITERKQAEEAVEAKSREIVTIWESMTDAFFSLDTEFRFTHINPQATSLVQKSREELLGVNIWDAFPQSVNTTVAYTEYHRAMQGQIPVRFEDFSQRLGKSFEVYAYPSSIGLSVYFRDITERKQAEAQLIFQKTLLEAQSEASPDGILAVSGDGEILSYNQRYVQMWDIPTEVVASGDKPQFRQAVLNRVANPEQVLKSAQYLYAHRDERGSEEILLLDGRIFTRDSAPIISTSGAYYGRIWYFRDITERKQAETLLRESQQRLALATESAQIGIWDWDVTANQLVWDAQMFALYGIHMENFSTPYDTWRNGLHPEDRDEAEADLQAALAGDQDFHTHFRVIWPSGDVRHIEAHALVQRAHDGSSLRMIGVNRDITERKQAEESLRRSEERYRSLALATTQIVWVADANGVIEDMPAWREFTGQRSDEVRGWDWMEAMHPEDREPTLKIWARSVETGSFYETEYRVRSANGEYRLFAVRGVPVLETDGSVREWVGTCTDIHDIRKAEEELDRFFTLSLDMLAIIGSDGYMKRLNPAFEATLGYSPTEMMAVPFMDFVHPDDRIATQAESAKLASGALVIQFENRYRCRNGSYKWLRWMCAPYEELWYCVAHDITGVMEIAVDLQKANDELEVRVEARTAELAQINSALLGQIVERERAEGKVRVQARQNEAVAELGRRALLDLDLGTLLEGAVALVAATLEVTFCTYWERLPDSDILRLRTVSALSEAKQKPQDKTIGDNTQIGYTALGTVPVISQDLENETRFRSTPNLLETGVTTMITVPVHDGELHGVLTVGSPDKQKFSQSEVNFLQTVTNVLSSAIVRKRDEAENRQLNLYLQGANDELRANEAHLLQGNQISTDLMRLRVRTHYELQEALHQITEAASRMLAIERSSVWLFNEDGMVIRCHDLYERSLNRHSSGLELVEDANYFPAIKAQREVVAEDARINPATSAYWESYLEPNGIASILDVALVVGGKHIGVLCCEHVGEAREWKAEDRTFASAVASVASLVLESYERARVEIDLQVAKEEAERANHAKSEFLSRMSHELRTPLNAILGFGQILDKQDLGPLSKESVGYILKGGRHLLDLINEVLDIARVEAGHLYLSVEPIALDDIVVEACAMMWPLATERSIRLQENTRAHGQESILHVMADRQRLKQVLINLLSNAIKYNHAGGDVEVACAQRSDGWITIAVRDTGPGIAPEDLPKLFMPFERLTASDSEVEGTGLGLVLSQRLMTAMGGTLKVESVPGQGTTFLIALPEAVSPEVRVAAASEVPSRFDTCKEAERTYTALCIEDNISNLRLMEVLFQGRPEITLLVAMQGSIGLDMARRHEPDLILLDLNLADMHGRDVLASLQQSALTRDIPVVVISADATPHQVERLLAAGAKAYLTKPLDVGQFLHTLDTLLLPARSDTEPFTNNEETE